MIERDDERVERALRGLLASRDPGPATPTLHERLSHVTERTVAEPTTARRVSQLTVPALGLAAAVVVLLLALPLLAPQGIGPGPGAPTTTIAPFDPTLAGPGIASPPALEAEVLVVLGLLAAGGLAIAVAPGFRRTLAALALLLVLFVGGMLALLTHAVTGPVASWGGIGVLAMVPVEDQPRDLVYITADPGEPFNFGFSVANAGPLPIRLEGVVVDPAIQGPVVDFPTFRAVWRDGAPEVGSTGPAEPFTPMDLTSDQHVMLWLVGTASPCAAGSAFDPAVASDTAAVGIPPLVVHYSVLGLPRTATISLPFDLMQPYRENCQVQP